MNEHNLLPCPFCDGEPSTSERPTPTNVGTKFFCAVGCYCGGSSACAHKMAVRDTAEQAKADAMAAWNTRAAIEADRAKQLPDVDALTGKIAGLLGDTYHCTRVWEAWHVGTMSEDDFEPVDESSTPREIAEEIHAMLAAAPRPVALTDAQKQRIANETGAGHSLICLVESYINGITGETK